ncbi:MAG: sensor histidine kinase [Candidatus Geothermincolia bacterium]
MSVRTRLIGGTIVELLIFLLIILGIFVSTGQADRSDDQVRFTLSRLSQAQSAGKSAGLEIDKADDLIASGGTAFDPRDYNRQVQTAFITWENLLRESIDLSVDSSLGMRQQGVLSRVEALRKTYSSIAEQVDAAVALSTAGQSTQAVAVASSARAAYINTFLPGLDAVIESEQANAAAADAQSRSATNKARIVPLILAPVGLAIIAVISILLLREITSSVKVLKDGAVRLGRGDLDVVIDTGRNDEFNEVAEAFNTMAGELKRTQGELRQYAHTVSHDLKGPLSSAVLASSLLVEELEDNPQTTREGMRLDELARMVFENIGNATDLIDELLHLAEAGQFPTDVEDVDITRVVDQVIGEQKDGIEKKGIAVEKAEDLGCVRANHAQMYQLFSNLMSNAVRYSGGDSPVIEISRLESDDSGAHRFRFRDNGPGVDPEIIDEVFEPFLKGEDGGTGIGLATVHKIVSVYGGQVTVRNDGGAVFEFALKDWQAEGAQSA